MTESADHHAGGTVKLAQIGIIEVKMDNIFFGTKQIKAVPMTRQLYNDYRGWKLPDGENGADDGYLVEYLDGGASNHADHAGYISWSPKEVFDASYQPDTAMSFGHAIVALHSGHRVCRSGWNGKSMWLSLSCDGSKRIPATSFWSKHNADWADQNGGHATVLPSITMKTADGSILMGWLASQTDMLANDWQIVKTHKSDCASHNMPAMENGSCDCGGEG